MNMLQRLGVLPKQDRFYRILAKQAVNTRAGAARLAASLEDFRDAGQAEQEIHAIEHEGDELVHQLLAMLNESFVTPIDREDLHTLTSRMDDVIDLVHEVSERLVMYRIQQVRPEALELAQLIVAAAVELVSAIDLLSEGGELTGHWIEINRLENEGDRVSKEAIARLFQEDLPALEVIKWKDVFDRLEAAIDAAEDVANVLESIVLKHG
jgi:predicted phosphate transport protein (TIGR00153 family)